MCTYRQKDRDEICIGKEFLRDYKEDGRFATKPYLKGKEREGNEMKKYK